MSGAILILLAVVFAMAGVAKLASPDQFRSTLRKLAPPGAVTALSVGIPAMELLLAGWLVTGFAPRHAVAAAIVVLLGFSAVLLKMWRKGMSGCGCFGEAADSAPSGLARNVLLIALAAFVALPEATVEGPWSLGPAVVIGRLTVVLGAACAWPCIAAVVRRRELVFGLGGGV